MTMLTRSMQVSACLEGSEDGLAPRLLLHLVDGFQAFDRNEGALQLTPLCERLVTFLAIRGSSPRHYLAFRLWPDHAEEQSLGVG
jgi:hypothetical protein